MAKQNALLEALISSEIITHKEVNIKRLGATLKIKSVSADEFKSASTTALAGKAQPDNVELAKALIVMADADNLFSNGELMAAKGAMSPEECVAKTLTIGEIMHLNALIVEISGFSEESVQEVTE